MLSASRRRLGREEHGGVVVLVAVMMPVLLLVGAFVIDVGNWFAHKRHLQRTVDAGALAAGSTYNLFRCLNDTAAMNADIESEARQYGGDPLVAGSFNRQIPGNGGVFWRINAQKYFGQADPADPLSLDFTEDWSGSTDDPGLQTPCDDLFVDVKATEVDVPGFFTQLGQIVGALPIPDVRAKARVEIQSVLGESGLLPIGMPDLRPKRARVTLVNACTGTVAQTYDLARISGFVGGLTTWTSAVGTGSSGPLDVILPDAPDCNGGDSWSGDGGSGGGANTNNTTTMYGLRVALGGTSADPVCGNPFVVCYQDPPADTGAARYLRVWKNGSSPNGAGQAPYVSNVTVTPTGGCGPSSLFFRQPQGVNCGVLVSMDVDFGTSSDSFQAAGSTRAVTINGQSASYTGGNTYQASINVPAGKGPFDVTAGWEFELKQDGPIWRGITCKSNGSNQCEADGSFGTVQTIYRRNDGDPDDAELWPIEDIRFTTIGLPVQAARQDVAAPQIPQTVVSMDISGLLGDPNIAHVIRLRSGQGSHMLDCDPGNPGGQDEDELEFGCPVPGSTTPDVWYQINDLLDPFWSPCPPFNTLSGRPFPWECVHVGTGTTPNKIADGLLKRTGNKTGCVNPDNWSEYGTGSALDPNVNTSDPRIVTIFIVPYGSFAGITGSTVTLPVIDFADFYITDFSGQVPQYSDPCGGGNVEAGAVEGHFFKIAEPPRGGVPSGNPCVIDPQQSITPCIAVLVE